ncbi:response regulator transcription factor [Lutispora saccharofermentans]|uniref:Stage 0 sporulation protein A homolog n=1 Tax=Lutispora saccharofermentans TaxID=3024236 RepID=A0ABT1NDT8_9FIRM|nr:response regulator transcription factor [Lutispora saccharofermentans]MCQ1529425.1 response regulator transcription factor [Lutispora saccharofermentans]
MRLLLIEDEIALSDALVFMLKKKGYMVDAAYDGISGQEMAETDSYDLLIVDRMLPYKEGVSIIKDLRMKGIKTPVLILTAKDSIKDRVEGLDAGADDYLLKPFSTEELLARIRALSRRQSDIIEGESIRVGKAVLRPLHKEVKAGKETIRLTLKETQLLELLLRNRNQVITREQIINRVWGFDSEVEINIVEIYIHNLRKKLPPEHCGFTIETVRGIGYCIKEGEHV